MSEAWDSDTLAAEGATGGMRLKWARARRTQHQLEFAGERVAHDPIVGAATTWSARSVTSTPLTSPEPCGQAPRRPRSPFSIASSTVKR
jgi:hypothetical protein